MPRRHHEGHLTHRIGWLRAAVLGANDGVVSTASLIVGVAAANATHIAIMTAGFASLVAGAMSMAAGEYVSVSSQADSESAEVEVERRELETDSAGEFRLQSLKPGHYALYISASVDRSDLYSDVLNFDVVDADVAEIQESRERTGGGTLAVRVR